MKPNETQSISYTLRLRERLMLRLVAITHPIYERWFRRWRPAWQQDIRSLMAFERGSLGYALGEFLSRHRLDLIPRFEDHDVFHVLLGYGTSVLEESEMQFCLLGSGKRSLYVLGTCAVAWLAFPEYWSKFKLAFRKGKKLRPFHHWYFEYLLGEPLDELQTFIKREEVKNNYGKF